MQAYYAAVSAAEDSIREARAVEKARERKQQEEGKPQGDAKPTAPASARLLPEFWESIDPRVRPWVRRGVSRLCMHRGDFSQEAQCRFAIAALDACTRMAALEDMLLSRQPALLLVQYERLVFEHYGKAGNEAVEACVKAINEALMKPATPRNAKVDAEIVAQLHEQGIPERLHGVVHAGVYNMLVVQQADCRTTAWWVARFSGFNPEQWASQLSNGWYREFLKAHPEQDPAPGIYSDGVTRKILSIEEGERAWEEQKAAQARLRASHANPDPVDPDAEPRYASRREEISSEHAAWVARETAKIMAIANGP